MSDLLSILGPIVGLVGGLVGLIGGGLGIYYAGAAHHIRRRRFEREEQAREVEARMDDLRRRAEVAANSADSVSTLLRVAVDLTSELDFKAARKLCLTDDASINGSRLYLVIDRVPKAIQRDMERRALGSRFHTGR